MIDWNSYDLKNKNIYSIIRNNGYNFVSFSQLLTYNSCKYKWKRIYVDKLKDTKVTFDMVFGTAMHKVIQTWITTLYDKGEKTATSLDLDTLLRESMKEEYKKQVNLVKYHFSSSFEMKEYYIQGQKIIKDLKKKRLDIFPLKDYRLVGIEMPIITELDSNKKIVFIGYLDIVLQNVKTYDVIILDIKTTQSGWSKAHKADFKKTMQLLLYKNHFSISKNLLIDKINIMYVILKRQLWEDAEFQQSRLQKHVPANGTTSIKKANKNLESMISHVYKEDGTINLDTEYEQTNDVLICQYCHLYKTEHCNKTYNHD